MPQNKPAYNKPAPMPMPPQTKPIYGKPVPSRPGKPIKGNLEQMPVVRNDMGGNGFTPYAAGKKHYGTGRGAPNVGATGNMSGYAMRDGKAAARRQALARVVWEKCKNA